MARKTKREARRIRQNRQRKHIEGTAERPRLVVFRSAKRIYAQIIDDSTARTIAAVSDLPVGDSPIAGKKKERAAEVGKRIAALGLKTGIKQVVFDRAGYQYHGRVSAVAEGAREGGLEF